MNKRTIAVAYIILVNTPGCFLFWNYDDYRDAKNNNSDGAQFDSNNVDVDANQIDSGIDSIQLETGSDIVQSEAEPDSDSYMNDVQSETETGVIICDPLNCPNVEHGTSYCNSNNECDVQCLAGCTKNGFNCECPKPQCCKNNEYDPDCKNGTNGYCYYGICIYNGVYDYNLITEQACTAFCTTCENKEFGSIWNVNDTKSCQCKQ